MIREAKLSDLPGLLAVYHAVEKTATKDSETAVDVFAGILNDPNQHIIVAEEDGLVVSTCTCIVIRNMTSGQRPYALVENVATLPEWQGRGLASACMERAKEIAEANGCYKIYLTTSSKDMRIWNFYERLGYSKDEKTAFIQRL
jgi:ribosomal protein S18 acetylase RimI-like enzyme